MQDQDASTQKLTLCDDPSLGRIEVNLQDFFELSFAIAEDYEDFLDQFRRKWDIQPPKARADRTL